VSGGRLIAISAAALLTVALAGCGEPGKTPVTYEKGKYQGKPDTRPWDNTPNTWSGSNWEKGSQASWENALKQRTLAQNEYERVK